MGDLGQHSQSPATPFAIAVRTGPLQLLWWQNCPHLGGEMAHFYQFHSFHPEIVSFLPPSFVFVATVLYAYLMTARCGERLHT